MCDKTFFNIIIIGGGFNGLTSALSLACTNPNLKIALLEKNDILSQNKQRDGRAFAISKTSMDLFKKIGIWSEIEPYVGKIKDIRITDGNSPFYLHFEGEITSDDSGLLGTVIENYHIHNALRNAAIKKENIEIFSPNFYENIEFENNKVAIILDNKKTIEAELLIAADGRNSPLRGQFNIHTFEKSYHQSALVFNISHTKSHENIAQERFLPEGPFAVLPMQSDYESSIVWTVKTDMADTIINLDEENFLTQLKKRLITTNTPANQLLQKNSRHFDFLDRSVSEYTREPKNQNNEEVCSKSYDLQEYCYLGEIKVITKPFKYELNLILADDYFYKRAVLVGDAVHGIHPIAGQGFNLGIDDIKVLTDLVKEYFECGLDIGSVTLLEKYQKLRKLGAGKMILATDSLNALFSNKILSIKLVRDLGLAMVEKLPKLKKFFIKNAGGSK